MSSMRWVRAAMMASISMGAMALAGPAFAQESAAGAEAASTASQAPNDPAQSAGADVENEIVVTARRRSEVLQDVPIAVTAYSGQQLERQGALDITDIGDTTPNVTLETSRGTNTTLTAFIRGVGQQDPVAGFEQGVGLYLDDVYLNRPQGALLDIYDVERIEVLRGPQGTLYGRNTIGGAVKYVTRRLGDLPTINMHTNLGTYDQADFVVTASSPIAGPLKIGGSFARLSRGGFGKNLTTGDENYNRDVMAGRGTIELDGGESFLRLSGDYTEDLSNPRGGHRLIKSLVSGAPVLGDKFDSRGGLDDPKQKVTGGGLALHGELAVNDWLKLRSITAWRKDRSDTPIDFDALPAVSLDVPAIYKNKQFSQEVQAVVARGPLAGVVGAYYLDANAYDIFDVRIYDAAPGLGITAATEGDVDTKTWAIFGDFSYDVTQQISLSLGARYTSDKRHAKVFRQTYILGGSPELGGSYDPSSGATFGVGVPFGAPTSDFEGRRKDTAFTPRASISFKPNTDNNIYLSYSRGFKGGGFDPRAQSSAAPTQSPADVFDYMAFDPETVDSYELGWKGAAFDRRLTFAMALFQANYKDVQVPGSAGCIDTNGNASFCGVTTNAGKARFRGFELETNLAVAEDFAAAGDKLSLAGTLGYLDAQYLKFETLLDGETTDVADIRKVQNTPKWTMSGSMNYDTPAWGGRLNANTTLSYRSKSQQFELAVPMLDQKGFALLDANIVWHSPGNRYTIGLHGKNLTDTRYITAGYNFLAQDPLTGAFLRDGDGNYIPAAGLGKEGVLTAYYGNPRQVFVSLGLNF